MSTHVAAVVGRARFKGTPAEEAQRARLTEQPWLNIPIALDQEGRGGGRRRAEEQIIFTCLFVYFQRIIVGIAAAELFLIAFFFLFFF